jgi:hypothetical protein
LITKSFKKIRIKQDKMNPDLENLFSIKESLRNKISEIENSDNADEGIDELFGLEEEYDDAVDKIATICAQKNKELVEEYLGKTNDTLEGFSQSKVWSLKKKLAPKNTLDPPSAKRNKEGKLVTNKEELEELYLDTYVERLAPNPIKDGLEEIMKLKEMLFDMRMLNSTFEVTGDWTMEDLQKVLRSLKNNKARDAHGHIYELFKFGGQDLKYSLLRLFNIMKKKQIYPDIFLPSNISSFYKLKGSKDDMNSERGVFNVVKIRSIFDKLLLNDKYEIIDKSMSCSNIGARKGRNIRDHLFVINGILNEAVQKKNKNIDIQIVDIEKCFDKMSFKETANDLYTAGVQDDKFLLITKSNEKCKVAVKTPWGSVSKRVEMKQIEMQGTVLAPLKCSVQLDTLGKECLMNGEGLYKYKECLNIPPLLMIDDAIAISECGVDSVKVNAIIQSKVDMKNLKLGHSKCFKMHVGKNASCCPILKVEDKEMLSSSREKYLGDILTSDCKISSNIEERVNKGMGIVNQIISLLKEISFGEHYFEMAVMFRQSMLINSILCNSEVLYGLNNTHIESLEAVDTHLWRNVFSSMVTTSIESYFIETNTIPIRYILMARRIMYYWTILQKEENELVRKVFETQRLLSNKNDWVLQLKNDLEECNITLPEKDIKAMKKETFKNIVKSQIKNLSMNYLINLRSKHSKTENLIIEKQMKPYLKSSNITLDEKKLLFAMKTRSVNVKTNFKNGFSNMLCRLCAKPGEDESELHLMHCKEIVSESDIRDQMKNITYKDIFGPLDKQIIAIKTWKKVFKVWNIKLDVFRRSPSGHQVHQPVGQSASYTLNASAAQTVDLLPPDDSANTVYDFG